MRTLPAAKALVAAGKSPDNAAFRAAFTTVADGYDGVTGPREPAAETTAARSP